jgi:CubicO group peptidase (beta-lactamase class C family)
MKEYEANPAAFDIPADMEPWLWFACQAPLDYTPRTEMHYSNFGYSMLGLILERVSGKSLDTLLRERLFEPLGMKKSYLIVPESEWGKVYQFPKDAECEDKPNQEEWLRSTSASGGMYSTVDDMQIFAQMLLNGGTYNGVRILSPVTVKYMTRNYIPGVSAVYDGALVFEEAGWGLGWNIAQHKLDEESGPLKSASAYVHGGWGRCMLWIDPALETAGILFYPKLPPQWRRFDDYFRNIVTSAITDGGSGDRG